jgi:vancomycin resistance protein YoaR
MTDLPNSTPDGDAPATTPDDGTTTGDPELASLVAPEAPQEAGDPELAALVGPAPGTPGRRRGPRMGRRVSAPPGAGDPELAALVAASSAVDTDAAPFEAAPVTAPDVEMAPVLPVAAAVTEGDHPAPPRRRRSLVRLFGVSFALGVLLTLGLGAGALYAWDQQYSGRILPGVRVGDTELGGLTREQAEAKITSVYGSLGTGQITLTGPDGQTTTISYADLSRGPDTVALLDAALAEGRQGEPLEALIGAARAAIHGVTLDSAVAYDHDKLVATVDTLATSIDRTPVSAYVSAGEGGTFGVTPATEGRAVDKAALLTALEQQVGALDAPASITMAVPVVSLAPATVTASADTAKSAADRMAADVVIAHGTDSWTVPGTSLAPLISFSTASDGTISPVFDAAGLDPILKTLGKQVNLAARDAGLKLVNGRVIVTGSSREGRTLDTAGMKNELMSTIAARQAGTAASPVTAVVKTVAPKLSTTDAKAYAGKMKVISKFSVYYFVIINNHFGGNIEAPATKINGTVVPAGTVFDFWKVVGDLRKLPGAGPGNAIEGGKITVTGAFGGGICTTSTTLFNAAFRAGMVPMARQNHNEFINRYPPGLDATVWIVGKAKQTMSFRNDTKYPILISRTITNAGGKRWITFKIWSVPNGRTYKISNLVIQHGPKAVDTVVRDRSKPVGYVFRNNAPADGAKVWVTVSIYDHGKLHWSKRYYSSYPAVDGVTIVGTKPPGT